MWIWTNSSKTIENIFLKCYTYLIKKFGKNCSEIKIAALVDLQRLFDYISYTNYATMHILGFNLNVNFTIVHISQQFPMEFPCCEIRQRSTFTQDLGSLDVDTQLFPSLSPDIS